MSDPAPTVGAMNDNDRLVLEIANRFYLSPGSRENAIRDELELSPVRFWAHVNRLIDDPEAAFECPELVNRLRRIRAAGLRARGRRAA